MEDKTKKIIVGGFIGFIMVLSTFAVIFSGSGNEVETYRYKDKVFINTGYGWSADINGLKITIETDPKELDSIEVPDVNVAQLNSGQKVYMTVNPEQDGMVKSISYFNTYVRPFVSVRWITACTIDNEKCGDAPIRTCSDATSTVKVIQFEENNETKITYNNNCLIVQGKEPELTRYTDRIILKMLGL